MFVGGGDVTYMDYQLLNNINTMHLNKGLLQEHEFEPYADNSNCIYYLWACALFYCE
jgi:hypothetical protein